jgi:hypothetical protein
LLLKDSQKEMEIAAIMALNAHLKLKRNLRSIPVADSNWTSR